MDCSLECWGGVAVSLEGSVDDIGSLVDEIRHHWLVHGAVPWDISWLPHSVSVAHLVVLVEDWLLPGHPLSMGIGNWRVPRENSADVPPVEVWVVQESPFVESVVVENDWSLVTETSADALRHEEQEICVGDPASNIETLNWKFPDHGQTQQASNLGSGRVVSPVPVGGLSWSCDDIIHFASWEPRLEDVEVLLGLWSPLWDPFLDFVAGQTEANKLIILNVIGDLIVHNSSLSIIVGILFFLVENTGILSSICKVFAILNWDERFGWGSHF